MNTKVKRQQKNKKAAAKRKARARKEVTNAKQSRMKRTTATKSIGRREKTSRIIATILLVMTLIIVVVIVVIASSHNSKFESSEITSTKTTLQEQPKESKLRSPDNAINSLDPEAKKAYIASMIPKAKFKIGEVVREFDDVGTVVGYVEDRVSYGEPPELLYRIRLDSGEIREVTESLLEKF